MADQRNSGAAARLARVREDVDGWRRTRAKLGPMPEALWREASAVARLVGVPAVASALGINAARLWAHARAGAAVKRKARPRAAPRPLAFVELRGAEVLPTAPPPASDGVIVELIDGRGGKLTVRLPAVAACDVTRLVEAFRRPAA